MGRSKSRPTSSSSSIMNLPHDVLVTELLPRLPVKTLFVLRSVCRKLLELVDGPVRRQYDGSAARRRRRNHPFLLFSVNNPGRLKVFDFLAPGSGCFSSRRYSTFEFPDGHGQWGHTRSVYSICRGLACFVTIMSEYGRSIHITVVNPSTRERVSIPDAPKSADGDSVGFGFLSSTNEYKIVLLFDERIRKPGRSRHKVMVGCEVFTLTDGGDPGSCSWRRTANRAPKCDHLDENPSCIDGVIYWVTLTTRTVLAFDLETEQFTTISRPVDLVDKWVPALLDWGGSLCLIQWYGFEDDTDERTCRSKYNIWILKKDNVSSYSWIRQPYEIVTRSCSTTASWSPGITNDHPPLSREKKPVREEEEDLLVLDYRVDYRSKYDAYIMTSVPSYNNKGQKTLVKVYDQKERFFNINGAPLVYFETLFALTPRPSYNSNKNKKEEVATYIDPRKRKLLSYDRVLVRKRR